MKTLIFVLLLPCVLSATTRYIAATAGTFTGGVACNGQNAITPATWNATPELPGDVSYICGTLTGSAGAGSYLEFGWSGTNGSLIKLIFDTGAVMTAPYWLNNNSGHGGAIDLNSQSYVMVDGGTNGIIENSANGTILANQQTSEGIEAGNCQNCIIKNLSIINIYVRPAGTLYLETPADFNDNAIHAGNFSNLTISNNVIHDTGWAVVLGEAGTNGDNLYFYGNEVYNSEHSLQGAPVHLYVYNNKFHDWSNWDVPGFAQFGSGNSEITFYTTSAATYLDNVTVALMASGLNTPLSVSVSGNAITINLATNGSGAATSTVSQVIAAVVASAQASVILQAPTTTGNGTGIVAPVGATTLSMGYHHDGFHCYAGTTGNTTSAYVYNNRFYGSPGVSFNQAIFLEGGSSTTKCLASGGNAYIFNNTALLSGVFPAFGGIIGGTGFASPNSGIYVNNTMIGDQTGGTPFTIETQVALNVTLENNAVGGSGFLLTDSGVSTSSYSVLDNNAYQNCTSFNCFDAHGVDTGNFALWQSQSGFDAHSLANLSSSTYFRLDSNGVPLGGSPLIGAGANLTSICSGQPTPGLGALCSDINGVTRPATGPWDIGAYQFSAIPGASISGGQISGGVIH